MGKQGPCCHCGVTSTPLWRNGPPDKPVLCNACGSRWRTKGTLANYTPLHARADPEFEDLGISRVKCLPVYKKKEMNLQKRKRQNDNSTVGVAFLDHYQSFSGAIDEDTSNRSSSGSAISNSESSAQFGSGDASDLTGPAQSIVWDTMVPSRKRTCMGRQKPTSVEKLTQDLYTILHKQQSYFSGSSEEDLLFETGKPLVSAEIVHGSVLMRNPSSIAREEESEASSLTVENKQYSQNEAYSYTPNHHVHSENHNKKSKFFNPASEAVKCMDPVKRENFQQEKLQFLENCYSLLWDVDLSDVLNYEVFMRQLTNEEQQRLLKYLPPADATKHADGLKRMFESRQYKENLNSFQQLLAAGIFDVSFSDSKSEDCRTLNKLAPKFKQVEHSHPLRECSLPNAAKSSRFVNPARSRDYQNKNFQDSKTTMKSSKVMLNMKASFENKEHLDDECSCFSPQSLFALPPERSMLENLNFTEESSDQDLLLDVRSNTSFPQAELLYPLNYGSQQASTAVVQPTNKVSSIDSVHLNHSAVCCFQQQCTMKVQKTNKKKSPVGFFV